ncbi:MAG TPA: proton-conducting transporter membrane subunit, partial [Polyangiaceae bacterium]|nr:proton-conducting transporter membrane subunit [Polyangiaceae bacterium]
MDTADTVSAKQDERPPFGAPQLVTLGLLGIAAAAAAFFLGNAVPVVVAGAVAALMPKDHGWHVRGPLAATAGLLALFVVRMWPAVATAQPVPSEPGHVLSWIVWLPSAGAIAILFMPRQAHAALRMTTLALMLGAFVAALPLLRVPMGAAYHFHEDIAWIPRFGIHYHVAIDGISIWLVMLTLFITPIAAYASFGSIQMRIKDWCFALLLLEGAMLGAFVALDLFLFYVFWELMLIPMYFIIGIWGGERRFYAAIKFVIFTLVGSLLMLAAILYVYAQWHAATGSYSLDYAELSHLTLPATP